MYLQIEFSETLQPTSLASVEMWLDKNVYKWFMVSIHMTDITVQVVPPLHTCQIHSHQLPVCYMISTFSRGELLTVKRHRTSILGELTTHSNNRGIASQVKWLFEVRQR